MERVNILIVSNDPGKIVSYDEMLGELRENVIKASCAKEALERLAAAEIAVVLADVKMPGLDAVQLAGAIRHAARRPDTATIFVSDAHTTDMDRIKGYAHGAFDYVAFPILPELLRAKVRVFAELFRKNRELERLNEEIQRVSGRMLAMQDDERRRIARELHDSLGQVLTVAKLTADTIKAPEARAQAQEVSELIDEAMRQVRSVSHLLHPPLLDEIGLEAAIRWYLDGLAKRSGMETVLEIDPADFPRLSVPCENALYRIAQEAVTNAFRHSGGSKVSVVLRKYDTAVALAVKDDGKGLPGETTGFRPGTAGVGLGGMRQRAMELGGELRMFNANPGAIIEVVIPVKETEKQLASAAP